MQISITAEIPENKKKEAFRKNQESRPKSYKTRRARAQITRKHRVVTGEHECMKMDRIWEWIILNINKDRQMMKNSKYKKT